MKKEITNLELKYIDNFIKTCDKKALLINKKAIKECLIDYEVLTAQEFDEKYRHIDYSLEGLNYYIKQINKKLNELKKENENERKIVNESEYNNS